MTKKIPQILLTNDDGIDSPGLWAAAEALSEVGYVWVAAPREQSSGLGRSMPNSSDGLIEIKNITVHGKEWEIYSVGGSPAQTVQHAIYEIMPTKPDLLVSGINYGLNLGQGITVSGTVGAAMEGASHQIPSLAISLETSKEFHLSYSKEIDFSAAGYFTAYFARKFLKVPFDRKMPILKIDIPASASIEADWEITRLSPVRYYKPLPPIRESWDQPMQIGYTMEDDTTKFPKDSDVYTVLAMKKVSVTPIHLDMTANINFDNLKDELLNKK